MAEECMSSSILAALAASLNLGRTGCGAAHTNRCVGMLLVRVYEQVADYAGLMWCVSAV